MSGARGRNPGNFAPRHAKLAGTKGPVQRSPTQATFERDKKRKASHSRYLEGGFTERKEDSQRPAQKLPEPEPEPEHTVWDLCIA